MDIRNINRNIISLIILFCIVFQSTIVVSAEDLDPKPGQVLFGAFEYAFGETIKIIFQGKLDTNDEIWLFYNPTGYKVKIYDPDWNSDFGNEEEYYTPQSSGTWHAQFVIDTSSWPWPENWVPVYNSYTYVKPAPITDLQQTDSKLTSISLSWIYPEDPGVNKYHVEVKQSGQNTGTQHTINDYQEATITGLKSGTLYDIRVRPVDVSGNVGDWTDYVTMSTKNIPPIASIDYSTPSPSKEGEKVSFKGTGNDPDGTIESYKWWSDKDDVLSHSNTFSTTSLSPGSHTIFFKVKDNANAWSDVVSRSITVNEITPSPSVSISSSKEYPDKDESYKVKVILKNSGGSASGKLYFYENNGLLQVQDISVSKGSQISRTFTRSQSSPGKYDYKAEIVLSNGAGSRSSEKTDSVCVYSGTESINLDKDEYYNGSTANSIAMNLHPRLEYNVKWYRNDGNIGSGIDQKITGKIDDNIMVKLTKPDGEVIDSDTAKIVVEPLILKIGVILARPTDQIPDLSHDKQYYTDILTRMNKYYTENSYGRINVTSTEFDIFDNGGTWYTVPHDNKYYGENHSRIKLVNGKWTTVWYDRTGEFKDDAIKSVPVSLDSYDIVAVVHPGLPEQVSHNTDDMKTVAFPQSFVIRDNTFVVGEEELMGTWAHEFGHLIGVFEKPKEFTPDRYVNGSLRSWDLMASGNYLTDREGNDRNGTSFPSHMSSWTKEYLGWLGYNITSKTGTYWVPALEQMQYGDEVLVYDVPKQPGMNKYSYILEVRSENVGVWDRYLYDKKIDLNDTLVIYQVNTTSIGSRSDVVNVFEDGSKKDMVILDTTEIYVDSLAEVIIKLDVNIGNKSKGYGGNARIIDSRVFNQNGGAISTTANLSAISTTSPAQDMTLTLPDYDLHAFAVDGRHVGMNYTTGIYENQITGATASGDMLGGVEWIFVPDHERVKFTVSNRDSEEFLKKYPWAENVISDMEYNLNIYHEDDKSNRYYAGVTDQKNLPGKERNYLFDVVQNPDGTFTIILDHEPPIISSIYPANNSIVGKGFNISANYIDDGTGVDVNSIRLMVDGIDVTSQAEVTESSLLYTPALEDSEHSFELTVADNMENAAIINHLFTLDTTPPYVEITYPNNNSFVHRNVVIQGIATDLHPSAVALEIDGIKVSDTSSFTGDTTNYADGVHEIKLTATDIVGNTNSTSIKATVDNTPPEITLNLTNGTEFYSDEEWIVDFTVTDKLSGIATTTITVDGNQLQKGDIVDMRYLSLGEHSINVTAYDRADNYNSTSARFRIKPLPAIVDISPKTLNINSSGNWITGFIEVSKYSPDRIDVTTVMLNETIMAEIPPTSAGDFKNDDVSDLMVKFNRSEVQKIVKIGDITLYITGKVDGAAFSGNTIIRVIGSATSDKSSGNIKGSGKQ